MDRLESAGIVASHNLEWNFDEKPVVTLDGVIKLAAGLCLGVRKVLNVDDAGYACTVVYSYSLYICGQGSSEIFRYDNYHPERPHEGHASPLHHHRFDPPGVEISGSPFELTVEEWPELAEVIREAFDIAKARV
jgi:hypothetical protein